MAPPDFHIEKEKVGVLTGPDQVDGVSPFGKDTMVLPLYVIIRLDTWVKAPSTLKPQLQSSLRYIQEHIWQTMQITGHRISETTILAQMNEYAQVILGESDVPLPHNNVTLNPWYNRYIPHNRPILLAVVHDENHSAPAEFEVLSAKTNVVVAYNFRYNRPFRERDSPFYTAELRSIFACPAAVFYKIDAAVQKAWELQTAKRSVDQPELLDEDCDDSDYDPDEAQSESSEDEQDITEEPPIPAFVGSQVVLPEATTVDKPAEGNKGSVAGDTVVVDISTGSDKAAVNDGSKNIKR